MADLIAIEFILFSILHAKILKNYANKDQTSNRCHGYNFRLNLMTIHEFKKVGCTNELWLSSFVVTHYFDRLYVNILSKFLYSLY